MWLKQNEQSISVGIDNITLFQHSTENPMIYLGQGDPDIEMYRGNFEIKDNVVAKTALSSFLVSKTQDGFNIRFSVENTNLSYELSLQMDNEKLIIEGSCSDDSYNRVWLKLDAQLDENVYGGGEQFSHFNLRGKKFPVWTREQGVGRNKDTFITYLADKEDKAGGDYHTTFFAQPTFVSTRKYFFHLYNYDYAELNFEDSYSHEVQVWNTNINAVIEIGSSYIELLEKLTNLLGRQPELPEWTYKGVWLGIQGGTQVCEEKLQNMLTHNVDVSAVWAQDWQGIRMTSFGKRLQWDWKWNEKLYPELPKHIEKWMEQGVKFLGYINPYVVKGGELFGIAETNGYLALNCADEAYLVDFGEFDCGIIDFTNPAAYTWYKQVIKDNLIAFGLYGWMADFGEYLPTDCKLYSGEDAMIMHNKWPALWAQANYEALQETGKLGELIYFMRAGAAGSQRYSTLMWAGDQNVDWSLDDGLASVITAALSCAMSGCGLHTSDIGGYTTLFHLKRSKELFMRWVEFCAFTPVMRTHEGNRPSDNWQFDSDEETINHLAWASQIHTMLAPYIKELIKENTLKGTPVMRPLFLHYEQDKATYEVTYEYLLGADVLVAAVYNKGETMRKVYLPQDKWISLWDGNPVPSGYSCVDAPIGKPPVFYRRGSQFEHIFFQIALKGFFKVGGDVTV